MGGLSITQFDFEMVHAVLCRLELLDLGAEPIAVSQAFVELGDMVSQHSHFSFHDLPGLLGISTSLLGHFEFMRLRGKYRLHFTHASASRSAFSFSVRQLFRSGCEFRFEGFEPLIACDQLSLSGRMECFGRHDLLFENLHGRGFCFQVVRHSVQGLFLGL